MLEDPNATQQWQPSASSSAVDLTTPPQRTPVALQDAHERSRAEITQVMDQLAELYARIVPSIQHLGRRQTKGIIGRIFALHDALGRAKIELLPPSSAAYRPPSRRHSPVSPGRAISASWRTSCSMRCWSAAARSC